MVFWLNYLTSIGGSVNKACQPVQYLTIQANAIIMLITNRLFVYFCKTAQSYNCFLLLSQISAASVAACLVGNC